MQPEARAVERCVSLRIGAGEGGFKGRVWAVKVIRAGMSRKRELFRSEILEEAIAKRLFEGVPVNAYGYQEAFGVSHRHLPDDVHSEHRGGLWMNRIGTLRAVRMSEEEDGLVVGEVVIGNEEQAAALRDAFDAGRPPQLSLDIQTLAATEPDGSVSVLKILRADALDLVDRAAADGGFLRLVAGSGEQQGAEPREQTMPDPNTIRTADGLRAEYPELVHRLTESAKEEERRALEPKHGAEVKRLTEENAALAKTVAEKDTKIAGLEKEKGALEQRVSLAEKKAAIEAALGTSKLPKEAVTETFRKTLGRAQSPEELAELIADREAAYATRATEGTEPEAVTGAGKSSPIEKPAATPWARLTEAVDTMWGKTEAQA